VRTAVFVQVRLGSTRLAEKTTLPLPGGNVIQHVMRALAAVPVEVRALLTDAASAPSLLPFAEPEGYSVFAGPEHDVLGRYCMGCRAFEVDRVVRVTGDNPLTSAALAREILHMHESEGADLSHYLGNPWGTGVEVIQTTALLETERDAAAADEREHITTFMYRNRGRFHIIEPQAPAGCFLPEARVTIDTAEDYARVKSIYASLYEGQPIETEQIVAWFAAGQREGRVV
jgi:spore coat polysaccharide biosynthesis protein SpsF